MSYAGSIIAFPATFANSKVVFFSQKELSQILNIYGRMVSAGLLKDYAISKNEGEAVFSFFRGSSERSLYRVVKNTRLGRGKGPFLILGADGRVLKRGTSLKSLLKFFDPKLIRLVKA